jgi:hypothetical protein
MKRCIESFEWQAYLQSEDFRMMVDSMKRRERERIMREVNSALIAAALALYFCAPLYRRIESLS